YRSIVDDVFDGDVQSSLLFRIATLSRDDLSDPSTALIYFRRAAEVRPDSVEALVALERAYVESEAFEPLLDVLAQRVDIATDDEERKTLMLRRAHLLEHELSRRAEAIEAYEAVLDLKMDPAAVQALHGLYDREQRFERQLELLQRQ